jgi:PPOX class probable F420-dependent enzyme
VKLTVDLPSDRRAHVERRLQTNLMAWLTTISPTGLPNCVPVWFLVCDDDRILLYSQPGKSKLRNIESNPHVALGLDVTDIIRFEGTAVRARGHLPANFVPGYVAKYTERIAAIFGTPEGFAKEFSEAVLITPTRLHA